MSTSARAARRPEHAKVEKTDEGEFHVVWINTGQSRDGDSVTLSVASQPIACVPSCPIQPDNLPEPLTYLPLTYLPHQVTDGPPPRAA
ncbi:hypothetical protein [Rhodococcus spongiicola]|nr:hypothetical protein [Rhodococcus spongiicola]